MNTSSIQQLIKRSCGYAGITQSELAKRLNMSPALLASRIRNGKFSFQDWQKVEEAFGDVEIKLTITFDDGTVIE